MLTGLLCPSGGLCYKLPAIGSLRIKRDETAGIRVTTAQWVRFQRTWARNRVSHDILPGLLRTARTLEMQADLPFLRVLHVLFGLLLIGDVLPTRVGNRTRVMTGSQKGLI